MSPTRIALLTFLLLSCALGAAGSPVEPTPANDPPTVLRVYYDDPARIPELMSFDLWEFNDRVERYVLVGALGDDRRRIEALGFRVEVDDERTAELNAPRAAQRGGGIPGFPCYRTVEETFATAEQIVAQHPGLAEWVDVGDSWEKQQALGGWDMQVLRLTNQAIAGPKPKLIVTSSIHAREYAPAELTTRFAERLVEGYGSDADVTWILDHHEIHLMLHANPDGRKRAETGLSWRKNTNTNYCGATSTLRGADLNRNFEFEWGCCGGSASSECDILYRGPAPASEPETQVIQSYLVSQLPDRRDAPLSAAAPADTESVYIDIHSFSELVLWPWGFAGSSPNAPALRTMGRRLAWFNGYEPQQAIELYPTDGTTVDYSYGELGVASFVFELGTAFFQDCPTFENVILPDNSDALLYAARVARAPYVEPAGPDVLDVTVAPFLVNAGDPLVVTAAASDTRFENRNGVEPVQDIADAEIRVDTPSWIDPDGPDATMSAVDGAFDTPTEALTGLIDTTGLAGGRHVVYLRATDAAGSVGPTSARFFWIADGTEGTVSGTVTELESGLPLGATLSIDGLGVAGTSDPADGSFTLLVPAGTWTLRATAPESGEASAEITVTPQDTTTVDLAVPPKPSILLVDDDDDSPDVRPSYQAALDALGVEYDVWSTRDAGLDPGPATLAPYRSVIWFTGGERGGGAGPDTAAETALAGWLDSGGCLLLSSQDYRLDRGLTSFMTQYLGVAAVTETFAHLGVTGAGVFDGLGTYFLNLPYANHTDTFTAGGGGALAFTGPPGGAGTSRDTQVHRAAYLGFGVEGIQQAGGPQAVLQRFLEWCAPLPELDPDGDGFANEADCAPGDAGAWASPGAATGLTLTAGDPALLNWTPPADPGAATPEYDVVTAGTPAGFASAACESSGLTTTSAPSADTPAPGVGRYYLVRVRNACGANLGARSDGVARVAPACP